MSAGTVLALAVAAGTAGAETGTTEMALTLRDAVARALEGNPGLVDARMDRKLQRYDRQEAEEYFEPQWSAGTGTLDYGYSQASGEWNATVSAGPGVEMRLPTGGEVQVGPRWGRTIGGTGEGEESAGIAVSITQPLARGAGWDVASAPVAQSALAEEQNVLSLRATLMDVVTEVIGAYRTVMRAALQTDIERRSLAQAVASRNVVEALIATGRIPRSDLTQSDAEVAEREIAVVRSEAANARAKAALAVLLGLDAGVSVRTTEQLEVVHSPVDERVSLDRALETHTGYRSAEIAVRQAKLALDLAEDATRLDLSLAASASFAGSGVGDLADRLNSHGDYRVTLNLKIPLGGSEVRAEERAGVAARIGHMKAVRGLATARRELEIEVVDAVDVVRSEARRMRLAGEALELAKRTERIAERKLRRGAASAYETAQIRNDLATAATNELNARIDYLNAVTALERLEGTVLARYGITLDVETAQASMVREGGATR